MTNSILNECLQYGNLPIVLILQELEQKEEYDLCIDIAIAIKSYNSSFSTVFTAKMEQEYYSEYLEAKNHLKYYLKDIRRKLNSINYVL